MKLTKKQRTFIKKISSELPKVQIKNGAGYKNLNHYRKMKQSCERLGFEKGGQAYVIYILRKVGEAKKKVK